MFRTPKGRELIGRLYLLSERFAGIMVTESRPHMTFLVDKAAIIGRIEIV